jgi:hypothetical protein
MLSPIALAKLEAALRARDTAIERGVDDQSKPPKEALHRL